MPESHKGENMKKIMNKINMAVIGIMVASPALAAQVNESGLCIILEEFKSIFSMLRTLAFVGAAFTIAGWAWGFISKGDFKMDTVKEKGTSMLVGFILLFGIGMILQFLMSTAGGRALGCANVLSGW